MDTIEIDGKLYKVITINRYNNGVNEPYDIYEEI